MCFISYGLALKQPFQRFRIFTLTWERKGSPVSLDVFSNWVETKSEMLIINVCICILFICRCIHTTTSYGMFRKHPLATGRFGLCPTWCTQMFHLVCFMFKWIPSACIPEDIWEVFQGFINPDSWNSLPTCDTHAMFGGSEAENSFADDSESRCSSNETQTFFFGFCWWLCWWMHG